MSPQRAVQEPCRRTCLENGAFVSMIYRLHGVPRRAFPHEICTSLVHLRSIAQKRGNGAAGQAGSGRAMVPRWRQIRRDRKSVGEGKSVSVRGELGGRRTIKKKKE